jgi:hypothetical protein
VQSDGNSNIFFYDVHDMNRPPSKTKNKNQNNEIENYNDDNNKKAILSNLLKKEYHHPFYPVLTTNYRKKLSKQFPSFLIFLTVAT